MSENQSNPKKDRETFKINIEDHEPFNPIAASKYITSSDFCKLTSTLFHSVFNDFEGCRFIAGQNVQPTIDFIFNHGSYDKGAILGVQRYENGDNSSSDVLSKLRNRDNMLKNGDRYYLTDDGKDVIKPLLTRERFNNGNPNWKGIVSEWQDRGPVSSYYYSQAPVYTKVSYIDLKRLCQLIFGGKDGDDVLDYDVSIKGVMNPAGQQLAIPGNTNYVLVITRASSNEVQKTYQRLGFGLVGSNIIR